MPTRAGKSLTREDSNASESEKSFVSAESENTLNRLGRVSRIGPSATATPTSPRTVRTGAPPSLTPLTPPSFHNTNTPRSKAKNLTSSRPDSRHSTAPLRIPEGSYFAQQPGSSGIEPRSPQNRRPPASRSSHGIETLTGPPPALSTQRSYTESPWRSSPPVKSTAVHPPLELPLDQDNSIDSIVKLPRLLTSQVPECVRGKTQRANSSRPSTSDGVFSRMEGRKSGNLESDEDRELTLNTNGQYTQRGGYTQGESCHQQSQSSHEDLFLDLARDDSLVDEPVNKTERRRSRNGASSFSQSRPSRASSSGRPHTSGGTFGSHQPSPNQFHSHESSFDSAFYRSHDKGSLTSLRDTTSTARPYAASAHPLDQRIRARTDRTSSGPTSRDTSFEERSSETPMPYGRRRSIREPSPGLGARSYKQSNLSYASNGDYGSSPIQSSPPYRQEVTRKNSQATGTESTVSTTAPSTVWDELDELKSRMRKLELTGTIPKSSNAAMSKVMNERPPTATTTVTTISTSPKRHHIGSLSPEASTIKNSDIHSMHPLLHSALAKVKPTINPDLYRTLEATASDALTLAAMTGNAGSLEASHSTASAIGQGSGVDRQLRRKADNMCRSLTELCIALDENFSDIEDVRSRPGSKDAASAEVALPKTRLLPGASDEGEPRSSSKVMSRLEARRASLLASSPLNGHRGSSQEPMVPAQTATPPSSRSDRTSSVFLRNCSNDEEAYAPNPRRPLSRAATEVGQTRPSPQTRISREYTSQHPMPKPLERSPSIQTALPTRRSYFTSATSSPLTPTVQPGNKRYLDRSTPPSSADGARLAEARQRRIASLGQGQSRIGVSSGRLRLSESEQ